MTDPDPPEASDESLTVGVVPSATALDDGAHEPPAEVTQRRLDVFARELTRTLGCEVRGRVVDDYPALLDALESGEVGVAWLPPIIALRAATGGRALGIVLPVRRGVSAFHTALFAKADGKYRRPVDLKAASAAWVDHQSASGYLVIRAALRAQGVRLEDAFGDQHFLGTHEGVVRAVLSGAADVGATFLHHRQDGNVRAGWGDAKVHIIARVGPIPADVIAAGVHVPVARIRAVQSALLGNEHPRLRKAACDLLEAEDFAEAKSDHLQPLESLLSFLDDSAHRWRSAFPPPLS